MEDGPPSWFPTSSIRISRVPTYFSVTYIYLTFQIRGYHPLRLAFPNHSLKFYILTMTRLFPFRSPLLRESRLISFPTGTEMFQFPAFASLDLCIQSRILHKCSGFPHSDIPGSMLVANSPGLFAGCHVFLRLLLPRHPPCALNYLTI